MEFHVTSWFQWITQATGFQLITPRRRRRWKTSRRQRIFCDLERGSAASRTEAASRYLCFVLLTWFNLSIYVHQLCHFSIHCFTIILLEDSKREWKKLEDVELGIFDKTCNDCGPDKVWWCLFTEGYRKLLDAVLSETMAGSGSVIDNAIQCDCLRRCSHALVIDNLEFEVSYVPDKLSFDNVHLGVLVGVLVEFSHP